jgi:hypothetical protein
MLSVHQLKKAEVNVTDQTSQNVGEEHGSSSFINEQIEENPFDFSGEAKDKYHKLNEDYGKVPYIEFAAKSPQWKNTLKKLVQLEYNIRRPNYAIY